MKKFFIKEVLIIFSTLILFSGLYIWGFGFFTLLEYKVLDWKFIMRGKIKTLDKVALVVVDEKSLKEIGKWPWQRYIIGDVLKVLEELGAGVIALDIVFSEPDKNSILETVNAIKSDYVKRFDTKDSESKISETINSLETEFNSLKGKLKKVKLDDFESIVERIKNEIDRSHKEQTEAEKSFIALLNNLYKKADNDLYLAEILKTYKDNIVLGYFFHTSEEERGISSLSDLIEPSRIKVILKNPPDLEPEIRSAIGVEANIPILSKSAEHFGFFNAIPDADGIYRHATLFMKFEGQFYPNLALEALRVYLKKNITLLVNDGILTHFQIGDALIPVDEDGSILLNYAGRGKTYPHYSFVDVLNRRIEREKIEGKIIFIGATATGIYDIRPTPMDGIFPGLEVHANTIDNILGKRMIIKSPVIKAAEIIFLWVMGIIVGLTFLRFKPIIGISASACFIVLYNYFSFYVFNKSNIWLGIIYPDTLIIVLSLVLSIYKYTTEERSKRLIKTAFEKYMSPKLVDEVLKNPAGLKLGGDKKEISVLFSDIRSFTSISERMSPEDVANFLHEYLTPMTDIVFKNDGMLDKYIGDAVMALFGVPIYFEDHSKKACITAIEMIEALNGLKKKWSQKNYPLINIGIGINTGECIVGNMGSEMLFDYTAIGDTVNIASRLEGTNKTYGTSIIISESTSDMLNNEFLLRELDFIKVVGKTKPIKIFEVFGRKGTENESLFINISQIFNEGLNYYRQGEWTKAISFFEEVLKLKSDDAPAKLFIKRCKELRDTPPKDWYGVYEAKTK